MMVTLYAARAIVNEQCLKPCGAESYKIESSRNTLEPFVKVSCSLRCEERFQGHQANTILICSLIPERENMVHLCAGTL